MIIGIDPGFTGGIAFLNPKNNKLTTYMMPTLQINKHKRVDVKKLNELMSSTLLESNCNHFSYAIVEDVGAMPGQGIVSTGRFLYNAGILYGLLVTRDITVVPIKPAVWKSALNLNRDKRKSIALACKLFPKNKNDFKRAKDDGRAEAALMTYFAKGSL